MTEPRECRASENLGGQAHPQLFAWARIAGGVWLLVLTVILYGYHRGGWWRPLLVPAAAGHFYGAYCLLRATGASKGSAAAT